MVEKFSRGNRTKEILMRILIIWILYQDKKWRAVINIPRMVYL